MKSKLKWQNLTTTKSILIFLIPVLILSSFLFSYRTFSSTKSELNNDGKIYKIELKKNLVKKYILITSNGKTILKKDLTKINPQYATTCDIDGDGVREIYMTVRKSTKFHKEYIDRPFFLNFDGTHLTSKWTGSKFGAPFDKVFFVDIDENGKDVVITSNYDGRHRRLAMQYWNGFGFYFVGESEKVLRILDVWKDENLLARIIRDGKEETVKVSFDGKNLKFEAR